MCGLGGSFGLSFGVTLKEKKNRRASLRKKKKKVNYENLLVELFAQVLGFLELTS